MIAGLFALVACSAALVAAQDAKPQDFTNTSLEALGIKLVAPQKDAKTGFVAGGKNATSLIQGLTHLNNRTIADLETDLRPEAKSEVGSKKGFLGADEKLLDVLAEDNDYVLGLGLTHQDLARHLHALGAIGIKAEGKEFLYHGKRFKMVIFLARGIQLSPFLDGTKTNTNVTLENVESGKKLPYSLLVPHLIERYGFYEGHGTPYRVDPRKVLEVLDFLETKQAK